MIVVLALAACLVPVVGGRLRELGRVRFRFAWLLWAALTLLIGLTLWTGPRNGIRDAAYFGSYGLGVLFLGANARRMPALWIVALGAAFNLAAISANGGLMPASRNALEASGLALHPSDFVNSVLIEHPRLGFLGDMFWIPKGWPLANVFSIGDVLIALGAAVAIHAACGSRLVPARWRAVLPGVLPGPAPSDQEPGAPQ
jgi:hypothetical protein